MNMTEYMQNPLGKGASVLMLSSTRKMLDEKKKKIVQQIIHKWFMLNDKYYIAHIKIPSKSADKLMYDVLIEIDISSIPKQSTVINNSKCRVFSNCPSFVFTYAYVFDKNKDIIPWTKKKYNKKVFDLNPTQRNPIEMRNYERSIYFAIKYITSNGRNYKAGINLNVTRIRSHLQILNNLQSSDDVLIVYRNIKDNEKTLSKNNDHRTTIKKPSQQPKKKSSGKGKVSSTKSTKKTNKTTKSHSMKKL